MLPLDSTVVLIGTTRQHGIGSLAVPDPGAAESVHRGIEYAVAHTRYSRDGHRQKRADGLAWLWRNEPTAKDPSWSCRAMRAEAAPPAPVSLAELAQAEVQPGFVCRHCSAGCTANSPRAHQ